MPLHALVDSVTNVLYAVSTHAYALTFALESTGDCLIVPSVSSAQRKAELIDEVLRSEPRALPEFSWNRLTRRIVKTAPHLLTDRARDTAELASAKAATVVSMVWHLNHARDPLRTGLDFQETVYLLKRRQAEDFKRSGYDEKTAREVPFVVQYADLKDISLKQAADDILLKAKFDDDILSKTELLRLRYFEQLRSIRSADEAAPLLQRFIHDCTRPQIT